MLTSVMGAYGYEETLSVASLTQPIGGGVIHRYFPVEGLMVRHTYIST